MTPDLASASWLDRFDRAARPLYLALVEALEGAIAEGELQPGDQLPPQRQVAERLGLDFTTVTRAYGAARDRGLVEGTVGRGTFVRARAAEDEAGLVDLSMNLPPPPQGLALGALIKSSIAALLDRTDISTLMAYHPGAGSLGQKAAAAAWLAPCLGPISPSRLLVCPGAQTGLTALMASLAPPGSAVVVEPLTYPGIKAVAALLGLRLAACPVDREGFDLEALERICVEQSPAAIYIVPTTQNPTATTMGLQRRRDLAALVERRGIWLIEDDPYSRLFDAPSPALASLAPSRSFHLATLSKCLSPGLRIAYLATPGGTVGERVAESLRATGLMAQPLMAAMVTSWIRDGQAETVLAGVRAEARARRALAAQILPDATGAAEGVLVWLGLPSSWTPDTLRLTARRRGLAVVTAEAFAVEADHINGVRISLGGPSRQSVLAAALTTVAELVGGAPSPPPMIV